MNRLLERGTEAEAARIGGDPEAAEAWKAAIRQGRLNGDELHALRKRCDDELVELQAELEELIVELRQELKRLRAGSRPALRAA